MKEKDTKEQPMFVLPLENFETKIQELSINLDMKIRSLAGEERGSLADRPGPVEVTYPRLPRHCLEVKAENFQPAVKKAYPIISAKITQVQLHRCKRDSSL